MMLWLLNNKQALKLLLGSPFKQKFNTTTTSTNNNILQVLLLLNHQFGPTTTTNTTITTCSRKYHSNFNQHVKVVVPATTLNTSTDGHVSTSTTTNKVNYFPIGETNFESIIRNGQFYIDKTHCIPQVEKWLLHDKITEFKGGMIARPNELTLARPNGWGKSTFLSMLHCYYDTKKKDDFTTLFGNLQIGNNPTINRNTYFVMKFDFSCAKSNFTTIEQFHNEINLIIKNSLLQFINYYKLQSKLDTKSKYHDPFERVNNKETISNIQLLHQICNVLKLNKSTNKLLVLVDEVDKQVNELILENPQLYASFIQCNAAYGNRAFNKIFDPLDKFLGTFYLLENKSFEIHHLFVNTTPVTFSHGFINNTTKWDDEFQECMGFTINDLKQFKLSDEMVKKLISNYGNYHFGGSKSLLNPSLVLRELNGEEPIPLINYKKYEKLLDHIETLNALNEQKFNEEVWFHRFVKFNRLVEYNCWTRDFLISYLIYQGLLSIEGPNPFQRQYSIPNLFAKQSLTERHYQKLVLIIEKIHKLQLELLHPTMR